MKTLPGSDASALAILAQDPDMSTRMCEELIESLIEPECVDIAHALIGRPANKKARDAAQAFRDWVKTLRSFKEETPASRGKQKE